MKAGQNRSLAENAKKCIKTEEFIFSGGSACSSERSERARANKFSTLQLLFERTDFYLDDSRSSSMISVKQAVNLPTSNPRGRLT